MCFPVSTAEAAAIRMHAYSALRTLTLDMNAYWALDVVCVGERLRFLWSPLPFGVIFLI